MSNSGWMTSYPLNLADDLGKKEHINHRHNVEVRTMSVEKIRLMEDYIEGVITREELKIELSKLK